jgi:hypothetical protein
MNEDNTIDIKSHSTSSQDELFDFITEDLVKFYNLIETNSNDIFIEEYINIMKDYNPLMVFYFNYKYFLETIKKYNISNDNSHVELLILIDQWLCFYQVKSDVVIEYFDYLIEFLNSLELKEKSYECRYRDKLKDNIKEIKNRIFTEVKIMTDQEKQKWVDEHIWRYQEYGSEELIDILSNLVSAFRQNEKCKSSEASLYVLNNGMECVESFLETLNEIEDNNEKESYNNLIGYLNNEKNI